MIKSKSIYARMPQHVSDHWFYRKIYIDIWVRKKNAGLIVTGATGSGKSEVALKIGHDLDAGFNVQRVVYDVNSFLELLVKGDSFGKLGIGSAVVFDESSHDEAMDSRSSLSRVNKQMAGLSTIYRAKRLIVIFVAPNLNQIDSRVRAVSITALLQIRSIDYKNQQTKSAIYWSVQNNRTGDVYYKRPRIVTPSGHVRVVRSLVFNRPPKDLRALYEVKKMEFINCKLKKWYDATKEVSAKDARGNKLTVAEITKEVSKNRKKFSVQGKINAFRIIEEYNVGVSTAAQLAGYLNKSG